MSYRKRLEVHIDARVHDKLMQYLKPFFYSEDPKSYDISRFVERAIAQSLDRVEGDSEDVG